MMPRSNTNHLLALAAVFFASACGSGMLDVGFPAQNSGGGGGSSIGSAASYVGVVGDSLKRGTISLTVSPTQTVTGVMIFAGGPTVQLTGSVDTTAGQLNATGSGYTISGSVNVGTLGGEYTSPTGPGFLVASADTLTGQTHKTYCGSYTSTNSNGRFAMQILTNGAAGGFVVQTAGTSASSFFAGTVINNTTFSTVTDQGVALSGTVSPDLTIITGSYAPPVAGSSAANLATGTFSATVSGC
jgi:hypothetical protein